MLGDVNAKIYCTIRGGVTLVNIQPHPYLLEVVKAAKFKHILILEGSWGFLMVPKSRLHM